MMTSGARGYQCLGAISYRNGVRWGRGRGRLARKGGRGGEGRGFTESPGLQEDFKPTPRPIFGLHEVRPTSHHPKTTPFKIPETGSDHGMTRIRSRAQRQRRRPRMNPVPREILVARVTVQDMKR